MPFSRGGPLNSFGSNSLLRLVEPLSLAVFAEISARSSDFFLRMQALQ